jgi:hypothetical protein
MTLQGQGVQRWDALWSTPERKRETRAQIVLGGAVLAALAQAGQDDGRVAWITAALDRHVLRVRDRITLRDLTGLPLPLRPGGALDETAEQALKAIGDTKTSRYLVVFIRERSHTAKLRRISIAKTAQSF